MKDNKIRQTFPLRNSKTLGIPLEVAYFPEIRKNTNRNKTKTRDNLETGSNGMKTFPTKTSRKSGHCLISKKSKIPQIPEGKTYGTKIADKNFPRISIYHP